MMIYAKLSAHHFTVGLKFADTVTASRWSFLMVICYQLHQLQPDHRSAFYLTQTIEKLFCKKMTESHN